jgi:hypothetical protein
MMVAMEELGLGPVHHMKKVIFDSAGKECKYWWKVHRGVYRHCHSSFLTPRRVLGENTTENLDIILKKYNSVFDYPAAMYPQALYDAYPDAKYIIVSIPI